MKIFCAVFLVTYSTDGVISESLMLILSLLVHVLHFNQLVT